MANVPTPFSKPRGIVKNAQVSGSILMKTETVLLNFRKLICPAPIPTNRAC